MLVMWQSIGTDHCQARAHDTAHIVLMHLKVNGASRIEPLRRFMKIATPFLSDIRKISANHLWMWLRPGDLNAIVTADEIGAQIG